MRSIVGFVVAIILAVGSTGCVQPRNEQPFERVTRLRLQYKIQANWYENRTSADGQVELFMSLSGRNLGREGLAQLTMIMHIRHWDGTARLSQPLTLDVSSIPPQAELATRLEVTVPGVDVREGEELALQLEDQPHQTMMPDYPEYAGAVSWGRGAVPTQSVAQ